MAKRLISLLIIIASLLSLFACTPPEIIGPSGDGGGQGSSGGEEYTPPEMNDDPSDDFTVTLTVDGEPYSPRMEMYAIWTDGFSAFRAKFDKSGVARIDGLDGDYRVRLSAVPNEYTYDPNSNITTNDNRNITVELYTLITLTGTGTSSYEGISIANTGVYTAELNSPDEGVFFMFSPKENGIYTIESWADVTADNVNPYCDVYIGTFAWNAYQRTIDDGGSVGTYTTNFRHNVTLSEDMVGNNYIFAVKADSRTNTYPVTVTFAVKRDGKFDRVETTASGGLALPTYDFTSFDKTAHEYGGDYLLVNPETPLGNKTYLFDEKQFKVWERADGGDGFYHLYDKAAYPETDGYGPILYAYITESTRFIDVAFSKIEYNGTNMINAALSTGRYNYKVLIEGYQYVTKEGNITLNNSPVGYFCEYDCPCHAGNTSGAGYACVAKRNADGQLVKCEKCNTGCDPCPEELYDWVALFITDEYGVTSEILNENFASLDLDGGVPRGFVWNGVSYSLEYKEALTGAYTPFAGIYTAAAGNDSFELKISDTDISFTLGGEAVTLTYTQGFRGYAYYSNSDGLAPVTPELRDFLVAYNEKQSFFKDGTGTLETTGYDGKLFQAVGDSGWLFACAYYVKKPTMNP